MFDIQGMRVLVTGGTSGLGFAIAEGLGRLGARLVVGSRGADRVREAEESIRRSGAECAGAVLDVTDEASAEAAVRATTELYGGIDGLVNAAGITKRVATMDMAAEDWRAIIEVNLTGTLLVSRAAGKRMREQGAGAIVNIASATSFVAFYEVAAYSSSKAGVVGLTQNLANDWAQHGIRVNGLAPGVFPTPLNRSLIQGTPRGQWLLEHTPMARFGEPGELVGATAFLLSSAASYITGAVLPVDGGFLARGVGC